MSSISRDTDPESILKGYFDAMNAGDADAALTLFADDAIRLDTAVPHLKKFGKQAIEAGIQTRIADHIHVETSDYQVTENRATCLAKVWTDYGRTVGFAPVVETAEISVENGKIKRFIVSVTPESLARIQAAEERLK